MSSTTRKFVKVTVVVIFLLLLIQWYKTFYNPSYKFTLTRIQILLSVNHLVTFGSYYVYRTYKDAYLWNRLLPITTGLAHFSFVAGYIFLGDEVSLLCLVPYLCFGFHLFMMLGTAASDIATFLFVPFTIKISIKYQSFKLNFVPVVCICLTVWSYINTILPPQHSVVNIPIKNLPSDFEKFHILHLSDIHVGPTTGKAFVDYIVEKSNNQKPDIVVISGDLVDGSVENLKYATSNLKLLKSKHGTFYVTGNHEYYTSDVDNWLSYLRSLGIQTLHNEHRLIHSTSDQVMCIAGIDDLQAEKMSYPGHKAAPKDAVRGCPDNSPILMIAHQPKAAQLILKTVNHVDLILSGHTHGGQIFPAHILIWLFQPYFSGLYNPVPDTHMYTSRGLRFYGAPIRFLSYPEYTSIFLHNKV